MQIVWHPQVFIGADGQLSSIDNLSKVINAGMRYSVPTLGVCAVGKDMERTDRFFKLANVLSLRWDARW